MQDTPLHTHGAAMPPERFVHLGLLCEAAPSHMEPNISNLTHCRVFSQIYLMATEGYFPVTYSFFALPASRLTFCSLVSVQEDHFGKLEHGSLTESNRRKGTYAIIKTNTQNLTAEFDIRRKCQMLAFNTWESQPASPWLGHVQTFLMKNKALLTISSHAMLVLRTSR